MQLLLVITEEQEIVTIAQVAPTVQVPLDEVVQRIQIDVGPGLRGQVADGQALGAQRVQQRVAGKPFGRVHGRQHACAAVQNEVDEM